MQRLVRDLNRLYRAEPCAACARRGRRRLPLGGRRRPRELASSRSCGSAMNGDKPILVVCNMTPVPRHDYRIGVPQPGVWREILNTDSAFYGGSNVGNAGAVHTVDSPAHGEPHSHRAHPSAIGDRDAAARGLDRWQVTRTGWSRARPTRSAPPGTDSAQISRCSPRTLSASICACSIRRASGRSRRYPLPECTDEVWHGYLPDAQVGSLYGYRAHGPYDPQRGHRFNPHKLLLDPYARRIAGELKWSDALFGHRVNSPRADLSFDRRDSAPGMVKGVVTDESFNWANDRPPNIPWSDTVIYEAHLRGLTMLLRGCAAQRARHFRGAQQPDGHRSSAPARHHGGRAAADPCVRAGPHAARERAAQLLGLQHARLFRDRAAVPFGPTPRTRCASLCGGCMPPASR